MRKYILSLIVILSITLLSFAPQSTSEVPNVNIKNLNGEDIAFSSVVKNGRVTVAFFWYTGDVVSKKEIIIMSDSIPEWKKTMDFDIVAVSIDDTRNMAKIKSYLIGQNWTFPAFIDTNQDLKRALNFQSIPFTIIFDKEGKIAYEHPGYIEGDEIREQIIKSIEAK